MHPLFLQTSFFTIYTLWIFAFIAIITSTYSLIKLSTRNRLKIRFLTENFWFFGLSALIGARLFAIIENFNIYFYELSFQSLSSIFYIWDRGLNVWGAVLGIILGLYYLCKKNDQNFLKWLDVIIPSLIIGIAISNIGRFFDGSNYGNETSLPWGVNFENPAIKYAVPIHPTQIYAFIYSASIAAALIIINNHHKKTGTNTIIAISSFSFFYFLEQFVRGDDTLTILNGIRIAQIIALIIFIFSLRLLYKHYKK